MCHIKEKVNLYNPGSRIDKLAVKWQAVIYQNTCQCSIVASEMRQGITHRKLCRDLFLITNLFLNFMPHLFLRWASSQLIFAHLCKLRNLIKKSESHFCHSTDLTICFHFYVPSRMPLYVCVWEATDVKRYLICLVQGTLFDLMPRGRCWTCSIEDDWVWHAVLYLHFNCSTSNQS